MAYDKWFNIGARDAHKKRYPLYAVLIAAEMFAEARQYARGWGDVTGRDLRCFRDP